MNQAAIRHRSDRESLFPSSAKTLEVHLSAAVSDIARCVVFYWKRSMTAPTSMQSIAMNVYARDLLHDEFRADIPFPNGLHSIQYVFEITGTDGEVQFYSDNGFSEKLPSGGFFEFMWTTAADIFQVPEWAKGTVYYQIFPDRFAIGDPEKSNRAYVPWDSAPELDNYFGGDLKGITQNMHYLETLGARCLYLNPIFKGECNHKYATSDYFAIDPDFGTIEDLKALCAAAHKAGIRVILDGVFNHCACSYAPFKDLYEKGKASEYKDWFIYDSLPLSKKPLNYRCFETYDHMPKLNTANPAVQEMILSVMLFWIETAGIDGWRLDVADEVSSDAWRRIRVGLKAKYPNALLMAEMWGDCARLIGDGSQADCAMNYLFRSAVRDWVARDEISVSDFDNRINRMLAKYSCDQNQIMYNLISSHDTPRFLYECDGNAQKMKLAIAFQMTFCGAPVVYYGDEAGMSGANDPGCRGGMVWDAQKRNSEILQWTKQLIHTRKRHASLRNGSFRAIMRDVEKNCYAFLRQNRYETLYVLLNNSDAEQQLIIPLCDGAVQYEDLLSSAAFNARPIESDAPFLNADINAYNARVQVLLQPYGVMILQKSGVLRQLINFFRK